VFLAGMQDPFLAGTVNEWDACPMKPVALPTGAQVNVVKEASTGNFYAIDNTCAHKKANLCLGDIEDLSSHNAQGLCVRCPKHQKKFCGGLYFDLHTGLFFFRLSNPKGQALTKAPTPHLDPTWKLATFDVKVEGDQVCHLLPETYL
jgi:nitrite reductase/ring-hydroxylating ferredoxin subunit